METDPDHLRFLRDQHMRAHDQAVEGSKQPTEWLGTFLEQYGTIAHPVHQALTKYYQAREAAWLQHAADHAGVAKALDDSANAYEHTDALGGSNIGDIGNQFGNHPGGNSHAGQTGSNGPTGPAVPVDPATTPTGTTTSGSTAPNGAQAGSQTEHRPDDTTTGIPGVFASAGGGQGPATNGFGSNLGGGGAPTAHDPGGMGFYPLGFGDAGWAGRGPTPPPGPPSAGAPDLGPVMMPTPFTAAVAKAKEREREPDFVVNGDADNDLLIARTLLAAVLAVVEDSVVGTGWAVSVMRGSAGAGVFITSNEGRGWLPPGLFLPREVSTPWLWDEVLADDGQGSPWEGVSDPARVLIEFGLAWGPRAGAELSALASSGPIDPALRARLNNVPMQGLVGPAYDVDLRVPTPDTADRLTLTGSEGALARVAAVDDSTARAQSVELAADTHARLLRSVPSSPEVAAARRLRENILAALRAGIPVQRPQWDALRDADDLLAASLMGRRVDPGRVELGALRVDNEAEGLRNIVYERRCNELVLLLANDDSTRQTLRDAVYAQEQVVAHPQFVEAPAAVTAPEPQRITRPAPTGAVSAPAVSAGPPPGAVAPVSPPPGSAPDVRN
ncbi:hypothetical protein ABIA39_006245 [Nocardia sp. GAS34]|uniref:type VII secretion target n=1 Tax=unclassified Nocardia TaxID=2637762 RepID=UPI003D20D1B7